MHYNAPINTRREISRKGNAHSFSSIYRLFQGKPIEGKGDERHGCRYDRCVRGRSKLRSKSKKASPIKSNRRH